MERQRKAVILGKLALHYYRPDFTQEQVKMLMGDYLDDLEKYSASNVAHACEEYRRQPDSKFFPKIGELIAMMQPKKYAWEIPPSKLPTFRSGHMAIEAKQATRSVAQVLRDAGFGRAAEDWQAWKDARPQQ